MDIEQQRARRIGVVGDVGLSLGHLPDQPAVDGAEQQLATASAFAAAFDVIENPLDLGAGEVGVDHQSGGLADVVFHAVALELVADRRALAALPDDGVVDRTAGYLVPDDGGLALVGDADGGHLLVGDAGLGQGFDEHAALGRPDFHGVMLDPARLRVDLRELALGDGHHVGVAVQHDGAGTGGALVEGDDELLVLVAHGDVSLANFADIGLRGAHFGRGLFLGFGCITGGRANPWQVPADECLVTCSAEAGTENRGEDRNQEIRDVSPTGEGHVTPTGQEGQQLRPEIPRRIHRKAGQRSHRTTDHGDQQADQQRGERAAGQAIAVIGDGHDHRQQNGRNHHFHKERLTERQRGVRIGGEDRRELETLDASANHLLGLFEIEKQAAVQPVDQCRGTEGAGHLRQDVGRHPVPLEGAEQP